MGEISVKMAKILILLPIFVIIAKQTLAAAKLVQPDNFVGLIQSASETSYRKTIYRLNPNLNYYINKGRSYECSSK